MKKGRILAFFLVVLLIGTGVGLLTKPVAKDMTLGLDLQGGFEVLYDVHPVKKRTRSQIVFSLVQWKLLTEEPMC